MQIVMHKCSQMIPKMSGDVTGTWFSANQGRSI